MPRKEIHVRFTTDLLGRLITAFFLDVVDEVFEQGVGAQDGFVSSEDEALAGACECDVQLAVDNAAVLLEAVGGEEIELVAVADGERVDDDVALGTLVTLYGVDADVLEFGDAELLNLVAYHGYLVAIGDNDANGGTARGGFCKEFL